MRTDTKEAEKLTELLKKAAGLPMMKALLAEETAGILAKRTEAAERIEVLTKERDEAIPRLQADLSGKQGEYLKAKAALEAAGGQFDKAKAALWNENNRITKGIGRQEQVLIETAAPEIDEAITFFREKLDWLRTPGRISSNRMGSEINLITDKVTAKAESNVDAVRDALSYCQAAIKALETLKLSPVLDLKKIEGLKKRIPDIEVYLESTGERALPGSKGINPRHLLKSDSQIDWEIGKIHEKIKKVMKR